MSKERFDIPQHITDKIVSAIERGAAISGCPGTALPAASCGPSEPLLSAPFRELVECSSPPARQIAA